MKVKGMLRILLIVWVLTVVSVCAIGGTFAQFLTQDSNYSIASITKWDVTVAVDGAFTTDENGVTYEESLLYSTDSSVSYYGNVNAIAPGASGYYTFGWSGSPTVDVLIGVQDSCYSDSANTDIVFYSDGVANPNGTISGTLVTEYGGTWIGADGYTYQPIKWGLYIVEEGSDISSIVEANDYSNSLVGLYNSEYVTNMATDTETIYEVGTTLAELSATLQAMYFEYDAGTSFSATYVVTFEWPMYTEDTSNVLNDAFLADLMYYSSPYTDDAYYIVNTAAGDYYLGQILTYDEYRAYANSGYYTSYATSKIIRPYICVVLSVWIVQYDSTIDIPSNQEESQVYLG